MVCTCDAHMHLVGQVKGYKIKAVVCRQHSRTPSGKALCLVPDSKRTTPAGSILASKKKKKHIGSPLCEHCLVSFRTDMVNETLK